MSEVDWDNDDTDTAKDCGCVLTEDDQELTEEEQRLLLRFARKAGRDVQSS